MKSEIFHIEVDIPRGHAHLDMRMPISVRYADADASAGHENTEVGALR